MNDADADRVRTRPRPTFSPDLKCASCGQPPTCPMLTDESWGLAWDAFHTRADRGEMPKRTVVCSRPLRCAQLPGRHCSSCEMTSLGLRRLLCLECAERALGRQLTLEDLMPCLGNYGHYVMQRREVDRETPVLHVRVPQNEVEVVERLRRMDEARSTTRIALVDAESPQLTYCGVAGRNGAICTVQGFRTHGKFVHLPGSAHDRGRHRDDSSDEEWEIK